jgi:ribosomal protein S18 acetylase RimI-like enzyme
LSDEWDDLYVWSGLYQKAKYKSRLITPSDRLLLEDFIYHAIFIPPGTEQPSRDIIKQPDVFIYIDGFGNKPGDIGVIAETEGKAVGAAWTRIIPGYGYVDDETPELATSVLPEYRGRGIGTVLMHRLFDLLRERKYKYTSLAVQQKNDAVRFYQRLGYVIVQETNEEFIMLKEL